MRIVWLPCIVLASLAPNVVIAQKVADEISAVRYETCSCRFGYGNVCVPVVSCDRWRWPVCRNVLTALLSDPHEPLSGLVRVKEIRSVW